MAASLGDLNLVVTADTTELTGAMSESREQLTKTITTIEVQDTSWRTLADSAIQAGKAAVPAVAEIVTALAGLKGTLAVIEHQKAIISGLLSPIAAVGSAFTRFGGLAATAIGFLVPQWKAVTLSVSAALAVYKVATSEMAASAFRAAAGSETIAKSLGRLGDAVGSIGESLTAPFAHMPEVAGEFISSLEPVQWVFHTATEFANDFVEWADKGIKSATKTAYEYSDTLSTVLFVLSNLGNATADMTAKAYDEGAALRALAAETERVMSLQAARQPLFSQLAKMQEDAASSAAHQAEVSRLGSLTTTEAINKEIRALQEKAAAAILEGDAVRKSQEAAALRGKANQLAEEAAKPKATKEQKVAAQEAKEAADAAEKPIQEAQKRTAELFGVLERQRVGVESGKIKPPETAADQAIKAAQQELLKLTEGQDAAAVAALRAKGATDEEVNAFQTLQSEARQVKEAQREAKEATDALKKATDDAAAKFKTGEGKIVSLRDQIAVLDGSATKAEVAMRGLSREGFVDEQVEQIAALNEEVDRLAQAEKAKDKITSLRDQLDVLNGSATEAEIAMRELSRQGFTDEQVAEISSLTAEVDQLQKSKEKAAPKLSAVQQGSREAAEIMLRGIGGGNKMERIAEAQLAEQKKITAALTTQTSLEGPPLAVGAV